MRLGLTHTLIAVAALSSGVGLVQAQQVDQVIRSFTNSVKLVRPTQLSLSPSGDRLAIADQEGNRIYVIDTEGNLVWTIGIGTTIIAPVIVSFEREDALQYYVKSSSVVFRSTESNPDIPDTVAVDTNANSMDRTFDKVMPLDAGRKGYLLLDRENSSIYKVGQDWQNEIKLVKHGSRKGELWSATDFATDLTGNIIVTDEGSCPLQAFTSDGKSLFCGGWNRPETERSWDASAVAVSPGDLIWVSDITNRNFRTFDRTGVQSAQYPFDAPLMHPNAMVITPDNRMFVADDNGSVVVIRLP